MFGDFLFEGVFGGLLCGLCGFEALAVLFGRLGGGVALALHLGGFGLCGILLGQQHIPFQRIGLDHFHMADG